MSIEEPPYGVESKNEVYEIRKYLEIIVAETVIKASFETSGNEAFKVLAGYIFGNNRSQSKISMTASVTQSSNSEKIAMTAPVNQIEAREGFRYQFTMPKSYTLESLPTPNDPRVLLKKIPARRIAVLQYSGSWSEERYKLKLNLLFEALKKDQLHTIGDPIFSRFNSPYELWFLRRNEIWMELK